MATKREPSKKSGRPARTPEEKERNLISLAVDLAEERLREGTASNQVVIHYLKLGTTREELEREKLQAETKLAQAKIESIEVASRQEELMDRAIEAMRTYGGSASGDF